MTIEGIADVQARIASIQTRFDPTAAASSTSSTTGSSSTAGSSSTSGTAPAWATTAANNASFADMLAALQSGSAASSDSTDSTGSAGSTGSSTDALLAALTGSTGSAGSTGSTGSTGSSTDALLAALTGSTGSSSNALSSLTGSSGLSGLSGLDSSLLTSGTGAGNATSFVTTALAEAGKKYVFGATASPSDPNPSAFDCSELVQWAAARNGVGLPRTAGQQYATLAAQGNAVSVDQALRTPGALLFSFSSTPRVGGAEPSHAHVAISLGDGRTIEARGHAYGVGVFQAGNRFQYAAVVPGL